MPGSGRFWLRRPLGGRSDDRHDRPVPGLADARRRPAVFGFAPGVVLQLIVLLYRRGNPRRQELLGELYAVPRIERPFWVAEQLEVAIFEGLRDRLRGWRGRLAIRIIDLIALIVNSAFRRELLRQQERLVKQERLLKDRERAAVHLAEDQFASLLADDVARGWRGRGWRGAQLEMPPTGDHDPPAVV